MKTPPRNLWPFYLTALLSADVIVLARRLSQGWKLQPLSLPRDGLGMLRLRDGALGEAFYLGEFPVSCAWLQLSLPDGRTAQGAAQILDDNMELVEAIAICDGILSANLPGENEILDALHRGMSIRNQTGKIRKHMLKNTRVDFSLLDATGNHDET